MEPRVLDDSSEFFEITLNFCGPKLVINTSNKRLELGEVICSLTTDFLDLAKSRISSEFVATRSQSPLLNSNSGTFWISGPSSDFNNSGIVPRSTRTHRSKDIKASLSVVVVGLGCDLRIFSAILRCDARFPHDESST